MAGEGGGTTGDFYCLQAKKSDGYQSKQEDQSPSVKSEKRQTLCHFRKENKEGTSACLQLMCFNFGQLQEGGQMLPTHSCPLFILRR